MKFICPGCNAKFTEATFKIIHLDLLDERFVITCPNCNFKSAIKLKIYNNEIVFEKEIIR